MMSLLINKWVIGAAAATVLAAALAIQTVRLNAARTSEAAAKAVAGQWRSNFEAMEATNAANVRAVEALRAEAERIDAAATQARLANTRRASEYESLRSEIHHVTPQAREASAQSARLSPVLCRTFNELRRLQKQPGPACTD